MAAGYCRGPDRVAFSPPAGDAQEQRQRRLLAAEVRMSGRTSIIALAGYRYGSDVTMLDARRA